MQTQCPHCETRFRVTKNQVNAADGFVRCSVCKEVFNAFEVAEQHELQQSLLKQPPVDDLADDLAEEVTEETAKKVIDTAESHEIEQVELQHSGDDESEQDLDVDTAEHNDIEAVDFNETSATDDLRKDAFDFFDEESNESLSHVVPEKFKESSSASSSQLVSGLLWATGILLLTTTLVIEYAWFNRDRLNQVPQLQAWTDKLCQQVDCTNITMRNPEKIELISRNVYSHPNEKDALMINVTMKNHAVFAQPYPVMQIFFSDVRGNSVAARRFQPNEYLPEEYRSQDPARVHLLEPDTNMTFTMEIQDPGKQAMTYEFDFL
jgi:predicted Zn finger-like uncharacterized protein